MSPLSRRSQSVQLLSGPWNFVRQYFAVDTAMTIDSIRTRRYSATTQIAVIAGFIIAAFTGCGGEEPQPEQPKSPMPFQTTDDHLAVEDDGDYRPIFIRGANLGVAVPGTQAGELAATYDDYRRWFDQMRQAGINVVRIYTLHFPRFYEAIQDHNRAHPDEPLYVMHGIWLDEDNPSLDLVDMTEQFDDAIEETVDSAHGNNSIDHRFGRAYGDYTTDISNWIIGWVIGREVHPNEVVTTNDAHPQMTDFDGDFFAVDDADPAEVWFAQRLETLADRERHRHGVDRPVSVSSWPTLDPIDHPTESIDFSTEEVASFDISKIEAVDAPGGLFATYHAYPYYPDYIVDDPDYRQFEDDQGPNSYLGYLTRLHSHYSDIPLFIGEFGVPSSWGNAHWGYEDMNHGGHDEVDQGEVNARLLRTIHDTGTAGGAVFAWIDEWWKPTWITDPFDFPRQRRPLWHNEVAPEQNFGLVAYESDEPDFESAPDVENESPIDDIETATDESFFRARIHLTNSVDEQLVVGFDTVRDDLGESMFPDGAEPGRRSEFALVIDDTDSAELYVTEAYDLFGIALGTSEPHQLFRSVATDGAPWTMVQWQNGHTRESDDGQYSFDPTFHDIGDLQIRNADAAPSSHDAVVVDDDHIEIRLPWSLLHVVDPSQRSVMHDDRNRPERQTLSTDGIGLSISINGDDVATTGRTHWSTWNQAPETQERIKRSMAPFAEAIDDLPYWVDE